MKNIFKETDVLLREYGAAQLTGNDLLLYEHNKKSYIAGFLYFITGLALHRFYLGDKFSKLYACAIILTECLALSVYISAATGPVELLLSKIFIAKIILFVTALLYIVDCILLIPLIKWHNLILKQNIIEKNTPIKDRGPYRIQEAFSLISAFTVIFILIILAFLIDNI